MEDDGACENKRGFYSILTGLIAYLQQQQSLSAEMKRTCTTLANTWWESMPKVSSWFKKRQVRIQLYLVKKILFVHLHKLNCGFWCCLFTYC